MLTNPRIISILHVESCCRPPMGPHCLVAFACLGYAPRIHGSKSIVGYQLVEVPLESYETETWAAFTLAALAHAHICSLKCWAFRVGRKELCSEALNLGGDVYLLMEL